MEEIERHQHTEIIQSLSEFRVVSVIGPRQAGKSTLVRAIAATSDSLVLNLDNQRTLEAALNDPVALLLDRPSMVVIDEIQRAPELLLAIKSTVDKDPRPGQFLITGSANLLTLPIIGETLTGRVRTIRLFPFSQGELVNVREQFIDCCFQNKAHELVSENVGRRGYFEKVVAGGFPDIVLNPSRRKKPWFEDYVETSIQTLRELGVAERALEFDRVFREIISIHGGIVVYDRLARQLQAGSEQTIKRYITMLETIFLTLTIDAWGRKYVPNSIGSPKLFAADSGLAASFGGYTLEELADVQHPIGASGILLEGFVVSELVKQRSWNEIDCSIGHFRTHKGKLQKEVDIILESRKHGVVGIEVKASSTPRGEDFAGLEFLANKLEDKFVQGLLLYCGDEKIRFGPKLWALPVSSLWGK